MCVCSTRRYMRQTIFCRDAWKMSNYHCVCEPWLSFSFLYSVYTSIVLRCVFSLFLSLTRRKSSNEFKYSVLYTNWFILDFTHTACRLISSAIVTRLSEMIIKQMIWHCYRFFVALLFVTVDMQLYAIFDWNNEIVLHIFFRVDTSQL